MADFTSYVSGRRTRRAMGHLGLGMLVAAILAASWAFGACATTPRVEPGSASYVLPTEDGLWVPEASHVASKPAGTAKLTIDKVGTFEFDAGEVVTLRPDIFRPGHFSVFDAVAQVGEQGDIDLEYHFDESLDTHVIDAIDGKTGWWYRAHYSQGWYENNVYRMDMYPYKNGTKIKLYREEQGELERYYDTFHEEVARLERNGGEVIIPQIMISTPNRRDTFRDVVVTAHGLRNDVLQPEVVTALDAILSLAEAGELVGLKLTWYESIAGADPVDSYWLERIDEAEAIGGCGLVYETGSREFTGFRGSHIHIPADVRAIVSPEYADWFWICL